MPNTAGALEPRKWELLVDPITRRTYYYDRSSGQSSWERPFDLQWDPLVDPVTGRTYYHERLSGNTTWERPAVALPEPVWEYVVDPGSGRTYYYERVSGTASWERPDGLVLPPPSNTSQSLDQTPLDDGVTANMEGQLLSSPRSAGEGCSEEEKRDDAAASPSTMAAPAPRRRCDAETENESYQADGSLNSCDPNAERRGQSTPATFNASLLRSAASSVDGTAENSTPTNDNDLIGGRATLDEERAKSACFQLATLIKRSGRHGNRMSGILSKLKLGKESDELRLHLLSMEECCVSMLGVLTEDLAAMFGDGFVSQLEEASEEVAAGDYESEVVRRLPPPSLSETSLQGTPETGSTGDDSLQNSPAGSEPDIHDERAGQQSTAEEASNEPEGGIEERSVGGDPMLTESGDDKDDAQEATAAEALRLSRGGAKPVAISNEANFIGDRADRKASDKAMDGNGDDDESQRSTPGNADHPNAASNGRERRIALAEVNGRENGRRPRLSPRANGTENNEPSRGRAREATEKGGADKAPRATAEGTEKRGTEGEVHEANAAGHPSRHTQAKSPARNGSQFDDEFSVGSPNNVDWSSRENDSPLQESPASRSAANAKVGNSEDTTRTTEGDDADGSQDASMEADDSSRYNEEVSRTDTLEEEEETKTRTKGDNTKRRSSRLQKKPEDEPGEAAEARSAVGTTKPAAGGTCSRRQPKKKKGAAKGDGTSRKLPALAAPSPSEDNELGSDDATLSLSEESHLVFNEKLYQDLFARINKNWNEGLPMMAETDLLRVVQCLAHFAFASKDNLPIVSEITADLLAVLAPLSSASKLIGARLKRDAQKRAADADALLSVPDFSPGTAHGAILRGFSSTREKKSNGAAIEEEPAHVTGAIAELKASLYRKTNGDDAVLDDCKAVSDYGLADFVRVGDPTTNHLTHVMHLTIFINGPSQLTVYAALRGLTDEGDLIKMAAEVAKAVNPEVPFTKDTTIMEFLTSFVHPALDRMEIDDTWVDASVVTVRMLGNLTGTKNDDARALFVRSFKTGEETSSGGTRVDCGENSYCSDPDKKAHKNIRLIIVRTALLHHLKRAIRKRLPSDLFEVRGYTRTFLRISAKDVRHNTGFLNRAFFEDNSPEAQQTLRKVAQRIRDMIASKALTCDDADSGKRTIIVRGREQVVSLKRLVTKASFFMHDEAGGAGKPGGDNENAPGGKLLQNNVPPMPSEARNEPEPEAMQDEATQGVETINQSHAGEWTAMAREAVSNLERPLIFEEQRIVHKAIRGGGPLAAVVASNGSDSVTRGSMQTLRPGKWLSDEIINYFLKNCLAMRDEILCQKQPGRRRSHFFNSFFMQELFHEKSNDPSKRGVYNYANVANWGAKVPGEDVFSLKYIVCPINLDNLHWTSAVIFVEEKKIQYYDSLGGTIHAKLDGLLWFLQDEHKAKKGSELDISEWKLVGCTGDTPQQRNGFDCGVFTCMFADFISKDCPLVFSQEHMNHCRERIALSIVRSNSEGAGTRSTV